MFILLDGWFRKTSCLPAAMRVGKAASPLFKLSVLFCADWLSCRVIFDIQHSHCIFIKDPLMIVRRRSDGTMRPCERIRFQLPDYPRSMRAVCGAVFAWASIAADACTKMLYFAKRVLSSAMSTSTIRPFAASRLA